jgi:hypothetical protein
MFLRFTLRLKSAGKRTTARALFGEVLTPGAGSS